MHRKSNVAVLARRNFRKMQRVTLAASRLLGSWDVFDYVVIDS
jgi:hypothetical protein